MKIPERKEVRGHYAKRGTFVCGFGGTFFSRSTCYCAACIKHYRECMSALGWILGMCFNHGKKVAEVQNFNSSM
jgi:hypothetical protein